MDEYIDIVNSEGIPTGTSALKSEAHKNGWYHNTVHLWLYTREDEILLQQRSHKKVIHPLLWDVSVAGHVDAGESYKEAGVREAFEEIGLCLSLEDLKHIGTELYKGEYDGGRIKDYEFHQMFIAELKVPLESLVINKEEVEAIKLVTFGEFNKLLKKSQSNGHFIPNNKAYYTYILDCIRAH